MTAGDQVRVYPQVHPEQAAISTIALLSGNECGIAVAFADKPAFLQSRGLVIHPNYGILLFAVRKTMLSNVWEETGRNIMRSSLWNGSESYEALDSLQAVDSDARTDGCHLRPDLPRGAPPPQTGDVKQAIESMKPIRTA